MKMILFAVSSRWPSYRRYLLGIYLLTCVHSISCGQVSLVPVNQFYRLNSTSQPGLEVTSSQTPVLPYVDEFSPKDNLKNNTLGATWSYAAAGDAWIEIKDNNATGGEVYKEGSYVGFVVSDNAVGLTSNITITTYLGADPKEFKLNADVIVTAGESPGTKRVGFWTTKGTGVNNNNFDRIRIEVSILSGSIPDQVKVFYAELINYGASATLSCNTPTTTLLSNGTSSGFPLAVVAARTSGNSPLCVGCSIDNELYLVDDDPLTSAKIEMPLIGDAAISVATVGQINPAGTFAGFDLSNVKILGVGVTSDVKLETYLNGVLQELIAENDPLSIKKLMTVSSAAVLGSERKVVGFQTTQDFDEVRLVLHEENIVLGTTEVFGLVLTKFCNDTPLACNTTAPVRNPANAVYVDERHTGIVSQTCTGCGVNDVMYAIDSDPLSFARMTIVAGSEVEASFAVTNAITSFGQNTFAGFDIETEFLVDATVFDKAKVELLLDGDVVAGSSSAPLLLGASASINGTNREIVGVVAKPGVTYNGVKITFDQVLGANLGVIKIHGAVFQNNCDGTLLACGKTYDLNLPADPVVPETNFPVVVNLDRTGFSGTACVGCYIKGAWNVISSDVNDFAEIGNLSSTDGVGSISVVSPIKTFPAGVVAGFTLKKESFAVAVDLFSKLTVVTYNDGVLQEQASGSSLLKIAVMTHIFGVESDFYTVGFITKKPFDEIRLRVSSLVGLANNYLKVYGAFLDARTASVDGLRCFNSNPDHNVTFKGIEVTGTVGTNDIVAVGTTYGAPVVTSQPNPGPELPDLNQDGTYTFESNVAGIYTFNVPVCVAGEPECFDETLTITVQDDAATDNLPVANDDVAMIKNTLIAPPSITVDVRGNDKAGNSNGTLQSPTISDPPGNGTASVVNGNISYTPNLGFFGKDLITYEVCESPSGECTTANLVVTVLSPIAPNSLIASDDYVVSPGRSRTVNVSSTRGVLSNDKDPDGDNLSVAVQNVTKPGVGQLQMAADGGYIFTPDPSFEGVASFPYQVCDPASNCQSATLYILTLELPNLVPSMQIDNPVLSSSTGERDFIVKVSEAWNATTLSSGMTVRINKVSGFDITVPGIALSGTYQDGVSGNVAVAGSTVHENNLWQFKEDANFITVTSKVGKIISGSGFANLGFHIARKTTTPTLTSQNITVAIVAGGGGETEVNDNVSSMQIKEE